MQDLLARVPEATGAGPSVLKDFFGVRIPAGSWHPLAVFLTGGPGLPQRMPLCVVGSDAPLLCVLGVPLCVRRGVDLMAKSCHPDQAPFHAAAGPIYQDVVQRATHEIANAVMPPTRAIVSLITFLSAATDAQRVRVPLLLPLLPAASCDS